MEGPDSQSGHGDFRVLRMKTLASGTDTSGAFEMVEDVRSDGEGPAPHVHRLSDEAFYILEGRFKFLRGSEEIEAAAGSFVFVPRGTRHRYEAIVDGSRLLILYVPAGGFVAFLRELDMLRDAGMSSAEAMGALQGKYDSNPA